MQDMYISGLDGPALEDIAQAEPAPVGLVSITPPVLLAAKLLRL